MVNKLHVDSLEQWKWHRNRAGRLIMLITHENSGSTYPHLFQAVCQIKSSYFYLLLLEKSTGQQIFKELSGFLPKFADLQF